MSLRGLQLSVYCVYFLLLPRQQAFLDLNANVTFTEKQEYTIKEKCNHFSLPTSRQEPEGNRLTILFLSIFFLIIILSLTISQ